MAPNVPESGTYLAGVLPTVPKASTDHVHCEIRVGALALSLSHNRDFHFLKDVSEGTYGVLNMGEKWVKRLEVQQQDFSETTDFIFVKSRSVEKLSRFSRLRRNEVNLQGKFETRRVPFSVVPQPVTQVSVLGWITLYLEARQMVDM